MRTFAVSVHRKLTEAVKSQPFSILLLTTTRTSQRTWIGFDALYCWRLFLVRLCGRKFCERKNVSWPVALSKNFTRVSNCVWNVNGGRGKKISTAPLQFFFAKLELCDKIDIRWSEVMTWIDWYSFRWAFRRTWKYDISTVHQLSFLVDCAFGLNSSKIWHWFPCGFYCIHRSMYIEKACVHVETLHPLRLWVWLGIDVSRYCDSIFNLRIRHGAVVLHFPLLVCFF